MIQNKKVRTTAALWMMLNNASSLHGHEMFTNGAGLWDDRKAYWLVIRNGCGWRVWRVAEEQWSTLLTLEEAQRLYDQIHGEVNVEE